MDKAAREQQGIVDMLARLCEEIRALELPLALMVGNGDFRPRIEYFHDAVRALTQGGNRHREAGGRLSIEFLAYDVSALRYLSAMPLSPLNPHHQHLSPSTQVVPAADAARGAAKKAARVEKQRLGELYGNYALLFVALFKPLADRDWRDRVEEMDEQVQQVNDVLHALEQLGLGKGSEQAVRTAMAHCESIEAEQVANSLLQKQNYKRASLMAQGINRLKAQITGIDRAIAGVETAHMQYVTAQLGIYEQGKETVKKMAAQGINLAGRFTEAAAAEQQRERGR